MKFQIRKGRNQYDGSEMFYVYRWDTYRERWAYLAASTNEQEMRDFIERMSNPVPEVVIAEIETP